MIRIFLEGSKASLLWMRQEVTIQGMTWFPVSHFLHKNRGRENRQTEAFLSLKEMLGSILKMEGTTSPT